MKNDGLTRRQLLGTGGALAAVVALAPLSAPAHAGFEIRKTPAQWRKQLGPERYRILRQGGTERPYSSPLDKEKRRGTFVCAGCALPLFSSTAKFESGTGWPSFFKALPGGVATRSDKSLGMTRTEALCSRCGGHLGHLFKDGPKPTGLRYCMNGLALQFRPA